MRLFAIFGDPVEHSRSPIMHNTVFKNLGYKACYTRIHLKDGSKLRDTFFSLGLSGANITVPHKEIAFEACDEVRGFAKKIGVVNTIVNENGKLIGYNTDADGFVCSMREFGKIKKILILGAGGTAKALAVRFIEENIEVTVLNRSADKLKYFENKVEFCYSWEDFKLSSYDLVINTTSAGLKDEEFPVPKEILCQILDSTVFVADAIYGKITPFLRLAKDKKIRFKDGADMLLEQGVLANELFVNNKISQSEIKKYMQKSFLL